MQKEKIHSPIQSDLVVLSDIKLISEFNQFTKWSATPRQFRDDRTQKEFAETIGVCEDTLTDWKNHPQFEVQVYQHMQKWMKDRIPDVIGGLYLKATSEKASIKDVEGFMRLGGEIISEDNNKK
jgi:hypothetical protein